MKTLQVILFFSVCMSSKGQLPDYYVFLVKGKVEVSKPGVKPTVLKQNSFVFKDQVIHLTDKAEITLSDSKQNFYVLKTKGTHKAKDLAKANYYHVPGVTEKYLKLVWNEFFNTHHDYTKFKKSNIAGVYGGVSRGSDCNNLLFPIAYLKTSEDELHFNWLTTSAKSNYVFSVYDSEGAEVINRNVNDTQVVLHLKKDPLLKPGKYYWKVNSADGTCEDETPVSFEILSPENEKKSLGLLLNKDDAELATQLSYIDKLEKSGFIPAASRYYGELLSANPSDKPLAKSYVLFLIKYHYNGQADLIWQKSFSN